MIPIVILAAGPSIRMGKPKQNLFFDGQTLLGRMIRSAKSVSDKVFVVLGANFEAIEETVRDLNAEILYNKDWAPGMSSSIKLAVSRIQMKYPNADAVIFAVCDQPFVSAELLQMMIGAANTVEPGIIACSYNNTAGVPALFKKIYFPDLLKLNGKEGAKKIIEQHLQDVYSIPFPPGGIDIDTEEDFNQLLKNADSLGFS